MLWQPQDAAETGAPVMMPTARSAAASERPPFLPGFRNLILIRAAPG
jgi:hypothetical protein